MKNRDPWRKFKDLMEEQLETVICTYCGKSYSNQATLNSHVKLMHSEHAELEACHICGKRFKKGGSTLWGHIRCYIILVVTLGRGGLSRLRLSLLQG